MTTPTGFDGIHHLKIFVTDLAADLAWWSAVVGAQHDPRWDHHTVDGDVFAYIVHIPGVEAPLELRLNPDAANRTAALDPVTFAVHTRNDLNLLANRLNTLNLEHSGILRGILGWLLVTRSPSGLSVRFYTRQSHDWDPGHADTFSSWLTT
ncbi:VOC family protein [Nocardia yunnanensis]|uniref:VOC family protein n=1 Tax=Nocardia yunnanensis TaxID=2382165 RepID=A0A386Z860_9NOCA|nr:VOC family protein [Nocardia yunnanensis]AYF73808.1 VOC family protein [Nocardia yunnanensis]